MPVVEWMSSSVLGSPQASMWRSALLIRVPASTQASAWDWLLASVLALMLETVSVSVQSGPQAQLLASWRTSWLAPMLGTASLPAVASAMATTRLVG